MAYDGFLTMEKNRAKASFAVGSPIGVKLLDPPAKTEIPVASCCGLQMLRLSSETLDILSSLDSAFEMDSG